MAGGIVRLKALPMSLRKTASTFLYWLAIALGAGLLTWAMME
jgi:hypothetical protein